MNRSRLVMLALFVSALAVGSVHATTRYAWGTIVSVNWEGNPKGSQWAKFPHFKVQVECSNGFTPEWGEQLIPIINSGRSLRAFILDGKASTAREALVVGRMVTVMDDWIIVVSSTVMGPEAQPGQRDTTTGIRYVSVGHVPGAFEKRSRKGGWSAYKGRGFPLNLMIDVRDGKVVDAYAFTRLAKRPYEPVDSSGWTSMRISPSDEMNGRRRSTVPVLRKSTLWVVDVSLTVVLT